MRGPAPTALADRGYAVPTLRRHVSAIGTAHAASGLDDPTKAPLITALTVDHHVDRVAHIPVRYSGRTSKRGNGAMRTLRFEAANVLIPRVRRFSPLKA